MKTLNADKASEEELAKGVLIEGHSPLANPIPHTDGMTEDEFLRAYRSHLANLLIARDPAVECAFLTLKPDTILLYKDEVPHHAHVIEEYWHDLHQTTDDYEHRLRAFKSKHNLDRMIYSPEDDGITHINVYSKGNTELGRLLSNFANTPFEHPKDGFFCSVEAYWYWLSLGGTRNEFRSLHGYQAKQAGKVIREELEKNGGALPFVENFDARIKKAILCKIEQIPHIAELLKASFLPLTHYYVWGTLPDVKVTSPIKYAWIHEYISDIRDYLNGKTHKLVIAGSRSINSFDEVKKAYAASGFKAIEIVSGKAPGIDRLGEQLAKELKLPVADFPADWDNFPKIAGFMRNSEMVEYGSAGLLVWDGISTGTMDTKTKFEKASKPVYVHMVA